MKTQFPTKIGALALDDVRTLVEIGYIGLSSGMHAHAATIFEGIQAACPAEEAGFIGRALVDVACGNLDAAIKSLRALPPTDTARAFLAMALIHHGDHVEARTILMDVAGTDCGPASELARALLQALDTAPAPIPVIR